MALIDRGDSFPFPKIPELSSSYVKAADVSALQLGVGYPSWEDFELQFRNRGCPELKQQERVSVNAKSVP